MSAGISICENAPAGTRLEFELMDSLLSVSHPSSGLVRYIAATGLLNAPDLG